VCGWCVDSAQIIDEDGLFELIRTRPAQKLTEVNLSVL
jgi:hypothetical protein